MNIYPLKFEPIFRDYLWGGYNLGKLFNKPVPTDKIIAESWEIVDLPNDKSVIANGPLAGRTLEEVVKDYPQQITGDKNFKLPFPILIKLLDCAKVLSVQVHPDRQTCLRMGKGNPKTECWYIIAAEPNSYIYKGLKPGTTKQQFADAIAKGTVADLLKKVPVAPGQCHFLPAGTVHAIGEGLLIAEIQMVSDTTYRVFDWNRVDAEGKPRPLHIEEALESIHFDQDKKQLTAATDGRLVDCEFFKVDKIKGKTNKTIPVESGQMQIIIITDGSGKINSDGCETAFAKGQTLLIPAVLKGEITFSSDCEYLSVKI